MLDRLEKAKDWGTRKRTGEIFQVNLRKRKELEVVMRHHLKFALLVSGHCLEDKSESKRLQQNFAAKQHPDCKIFEIKTFEMF